MANTLKFGNGNWATKDGSTLAYNDESGFNPLPFDFTRASSATVVNKNGLIETVASGIPRIDFLGNTKGSLLLEPSRTNLITQSEAFGNSYWTKSGASIEGDPSTAGAEQVVNGNFATDSDWTKATGVTISGGTLNFSGVANGDSGTNQSSSIVVGKTYKATFTVSNWVAGGVRILLGSTGTSATRSSNGTFTAYVVASGNTTIYLQSIGVTTLSIDNVSIKEVQGFASPSADSPLGAFKLVEGTNTGTHQVQRNITNTVANQYSISVFVKENTRNWIRLSSGDGGYVFFNISDNTIGIQTNAVGVIEDFGNGWKRCKITFTASGTNGSATLRIAESDGVVSYVGQNKSVYVYGMQYEQGSYATSIINTSGSAVTREADVCINGANSEVINSTEGVLYAQVSALANDGTNRYISVSDGTNFNRIILRFSTANRIRIDSVVSNTNQFNAETNTNANQFYKAAFSYKQNEFKFYVNGVLIGSSTSGNVPSSNTYNVIAFRNTTGGEIFYGETKDVRVFTTSLTDSELIALTSI